MKWSESDKQEFLSIMQNQLGKIIDEMQGFKKNDLVHLSVVNDLINFKLEEEEIKSQFQSLSYIMLEMAKMNFTIRVSIDNSNSKDLFAFMGCSLNLINEELEEKAIPIGFLKQVLEKVLENKPDYALFIKPEGAVWYITNNLENLLVYKQEDLIKKPILSIFSSNLHSYVLDKGLFSRKKANLVTSDEKLIPVEVSVVEITDEHLPNHYLYMIFNI